MFLEVQIITILLTIIHLHPIPILQTTTQVTEHQPTTIVIKAVAAVRLLENFKFNFFWGRAGVDVVRPLQFIRSLEKILVYI
jgi:hypothetical protein